MKRQGILGGKSALGTEDLSVRTVPCYFNPYASPENNAYGEYDFMLLLQNALAGSGIKNLNLDGLWGPCTREAFEAVTGEPWSQAAVERFMTVKCNPFKERAAIPADKRICKQPWSYEPPPMPEVPPPGDTETPVKVQPFTPTTPPVVQQATPVAPLIATTAAPGKLVAVQDYGTRLANLLGLKTGATATTGKTGALVATAARPDFRQLTARGAGGGATTQQAATVTQQQANIANVQNKYGYSQQLYQPGVEETDNTKLYIILGLVAAAAVVGGVVIYKKKAKKAPAFAGTK